MRRLREPVLILVLLLAATVAFTWPLALHPASTVTPDYGDPLLNTWIIANGYRHLSSPGDFFQGTIMYPSRDVITYSEHLFSLVVPAALVRLAGGSPLLAYNLLLLLGFAFSGLGTYLLVKYLTGNRGAGLAAGIFFAFCGYRFSQVAHLQICFSAYFPFTLLYLHKFLQEGRRRHLALFSLFFLAQCLASWHYLIYAVLAVALTAGAGLVLDWRRTGWGRLLRLTAAGLACALLVLPFALPYARTHRRFTDFERSIEDTLLYNARPGDFRTVLPQNVLYGNGNRFIRLPGPGQGERVLFPGLGILLLAPAALLPRRRRYRGWEAAGEGSGGDGAPDQPEEAAGAGDAGVTGEEVSVAGVADAARTPGSWEGAGGGEKPSPGEPVGGPLSSWMTGQDGPSPASADGIAVVAGYLALAACSLLLAFGPEIRGHRNGVYVFLYDTGALKFMRVPARFFVPLSLALAVLGGIGLHRLCLRVKETRLGRWDSRTLLCAAFCLFLLLESAVWRLPMKKVPVGDSVPRVYRWLAEQGDVRIIELPTEPLVNLWYYNGDIESFPVDPDAYIGREALLVYLNTIHWKDMVNGYSGYFPFSYNRTMTEVQGFPAPRPLALLEGLGIDYVIWHEEWVREEWRDYCTVGFATLADRLELVEDFGDQQVWRVKRAGRSASSEELRAELACPEALPPGRSWQMGIMLSNPTSLPFVRTDEDLHRVVLEWQGPAGESFRQEAAFHDPFFLAEGETWTVGLRVEGTPPPGKWRLRARVEGGCLDGREWELEVRVVEDMLVAGEPDASLGAEFGDKVRLEGLMLRQRDGLFPSLLVVSNRGNAYWPAFAPERREEGGVELALRLRREGEEWWEEERCLLPCDVAPQQTQLFPLLFRLPARPGRYRLELSMALAGGEDFGEAWETWMEVGEVEDAGNPEEAALAP